MMCAPISLPAVCTLEACSALAAALPMLVAGGGVLRIDASGVHAYDSATISLLLEAQRLAHAAGREFEVSGAPQGLRDLAGLYGVDGLLALPQRQARAAALSCAMKRGQLAIRDGGSVRAIAAEEIVFIEAVGELSQINADGKGYLQQQRLADLKQQLDPALFVEVHPTCLVNIAHLAQVGDGADRGWALLRDGSRVEVTRDGRDAIQRALDDVLP